VRLLKALISLRTHGFSDQLSFFGGTVDGAFKV
jgi:hypothetical protein